MFGYVPQVPAGNRYCAKCEVFGAPGEPCWLCGSTDLEQKYPPSGGHHHDPQRAAVSLNGEDLSVEMENACWD